MQWIRAACRPGALVVHERSDANLFHNAAQTVVVQSDSATRTFRLPSTGERDLTVPLRPAGGRTLHSRPLWPAAAWFR